VHVAAARAIDHVHADALQLARELDRLREVPPAFGPIGGGEAIHDGLVAGPHFAHRAHDLQGKRIRFSNEPPYSSVRLFEIGETNSWMR
jgi:hypothetical protein